MKLTLPLPPSINRTYGVNRNAEFPMYKRKVVKDWEFTAGWDIKRQMISKPVTFTGEVKMDIVWYYDTDRDIDSGLKVLLDLLQKQLIYKNDRQVVSIHMLKHKDLDNPRVELEVTEV